MFSPMEAIRNFTNPEQSKIVLFTFSLYLYPRYSSAVRTITERLSTISIVFFWLRPEEEMIIINTKKYFLTTLVLGIDFLNYKNLKIQNNGISIIFYTYKCNILLLQTK